MKVVLELQQQASNIRRVTIRHDIVIGRAVDCNLRISAPQVSRRHCFLRIGTDSVAITDLESCNGTWLNGQKTVPGKRYFVKDGMKLAIGPVCFVARISGQKSDVEQSDATRVVDNGVSVEVPDVRFLDDDLKLTGDD
ncbi:MAG: FHA domain-containing protein [Fuerstiella sp.]|nr:FHA domain-containing protein [Fuerstiella sp.]